MLDEITYDAFGNITNQTNSSNGDRFMFAGMQFDATTGLYYDHARYYSAATGRFMSQDPNGFSAGDTNLYRYAANAPTIAVDPSGLYCVGLRGGGNGPQTPVLGLVPLFPPTGVILPQFIPTMAVLSR